MAWGPFQQPFPNGYTPRQDLQSEQALLPSFPGTRKKCKFSCTSHKSTTTWLATWRLWPSPEVLLVQSRDAVASRAQREFRTSLPRTHKQLRRIVWKPQRKEAWLPCGLVLHQWGSASCQLPSEDLSSEISGHRKKMSGSGYLPLVYEPWCLFVIIIITNPHQGHVHQF